MIYEGVNEMSRNYKRPDVKTYDAGRLCEIVGPAHAQSGTFDVQVGAVAYNRPAEVKTFYVNQEYKVVKLDDIKLA